MEISEAAVPVDETDIGISQFEEAKKRINQGWWSTPKMEVDPTKVLSRKSRPTIIWSTFDLVDFRPWSIFDRPQRMCAHVQ